MSKFVDRINYGRAIGQTIDKPIGTFEFQEIAELNWEVMDCASFGSVDGYIIPDPNRKYIARKDTKQILGSVGKDYVSVQNDYIFGMIQDLQEFDSEMIVETAGFLGKGETVFVQVRMDSLVLKIGDDVVNPLLLIVNGHIGNYNTTIFPSTLRVKCKNGLRMAMKNKEMLSQGWKIRHTTNAFERLIQVKESLKEIALEWENSKSLIMRMADTKMEDDAILDLISATFGGPKQKKDKKEKKNSRGETLAENRNARIFEILESPTSKVSGIEGSVWAGFNAITEWLDHDSILRSGNRLEARFQNNLIAGPSLNYKEKAWIAALEMAGV